jgi:hypothetical protein
VLLNALRALGALLLSLPRAQAFAPIVLWSALIYTLSSLSAEGIVSFGRGTFLVNLGHAPLFGLLGMWFALALPREQLRREGDERSGWPRIVGAGRAAVLAATAVWGVADELHQHLAGNGRDFSLLDVVTDVVGAACVLAVIDYAGRDGATDGGLLGRLGLGVLACLAAAALATWGPLLSPWAAWL